MQGNLSYRLSFSNGSAPQHHTLRIGATVAGRAATCDLVLNHASISRRHARFTVSDGRCFVDDIGSQNGTFVNGTRTQRAVLEQGDTVLLGEFKMTVHCSAPENIVVSDSDDGSSLTVLYQLPKDSGAANVSVDFGRLLQLVSEIGRTLIGNQPVDTVLARVVELAFDWSGARRVLLLLCDQATGELVPRIVRHREQAALSTTVSRTILDRVLQDRASMLGMNAQMDPRLGQSPSLFALDTKAFMCAPLWHETEIIGLLYVDNPVKGGFSESALELFTAFSNYAAVAIEQARLAARINEEVRRRERLERYHSPAVASRILKETGDLDAPFTAQERDLTVLFADLVGFTRLAEEKPPQEVAALLNVFFSRMTDEIFEHEGTLDKFIGDSVLAVFGAPLELAEHPLHAVRAAQSMHRALRLLNKERPETPLQMRVSIHTGIALVGDIGSPKRRDYTVFGDVVNTASRLERVAGAGQTVITRATYDRLGGQVPARSLGLTQLRGQKRSVEVFELLPESNL